MRSPRVVQITDRTTLPEAEVFARIDRVRHTGRARACGLAVLLRDKDQAAAERREVARRLREATRAAGCLLLIATDVELARAAGADGVHLPSDAVSRIAEARLTPESFVSIACHTPEEAARAAAAGASAVLLSPIFETPGKGPPIGLEAIVATRRFLSRHPGVAMIALGGIDIERARACLASGADGVASIRADLTALV